LFINDANLSNLNEEELMLTCPSVPRQTVIGALFIYTVQRFLFALND